MLLHLFDHLGNRDLPPRVNVPSQGGGRLLIEMNLEHHARKASVEVCHRGLESLGELVGPGMTSKRPSSPHRLQPPTKPLDPQEQVRTSLTRIP